MCCFHLISPRHATPRHAHTCGMLMPRRQSFCQYTSVMMRSYSSSAGLQLIAPVFLSARFCNRTASVCLCVCVFVPRARARPSNKIQCLSRCLRARARAHTHRSAQASIRRDSAQTHRVVHITSIYFAIFVLGSSSGGERNQSRAMYTHHS